jgi:hypothetical protein
MDPSTVNLLSTITTHLLSRSLLSYEFLPHLSEPFLFDSNHLALPPSIVKLFLSRFSPAHPLTENEARILAMLLPDLPDSWLYLRTAVRTSHPSALSEWLHWSALVLRCHKKSGDAWDFRRFVLSLHDIELLSELDFICEHCELLPHNFYALNHLNAVLSMQRVGVDVVDQMFRRLLRTTPTHYGVYHYLRKERVETGDWLEAVHEEFRDSESYRMFKEDRPSL